MTDLMYPVSGRPSFAAEVEKPDMKVMSKPARSIRRAESASKQHGMVRMPGSFSSARSRDAALPDGTFGLRGRGGTAMDGPPRPRPRPRPRRISEGDEDARRGATNASPVATRQASATYFATTVMLI